MAFTAIFTTAQDRNRLGAMITDLKTLMEAWDATYSDIVTIP